MDMQIRYKFHKFFSVRAKIYLLAYFFAFIGKQESNFTIDRLFWPIFLDHHFSTDECGNIITGEKGLRSKREENGLNRITRRKVFKAERMLRFIYG